MKLDAIEEIANQHAIKSGKAKKANLVRAIQQAEGNETCFGSGKTTECRQGERLHLKTC